MKKSDKVIWILVIIGAFGCLLSCSSPKKLYEQGIKKIEKAIEKDPMLAFPTDTLRLTEYDTIPGVDGRDSIIRITETINIPCDFDLDAFKEATRNKTRKVLRFERRMIKDSLRSIERMYKLETKRLKDSLVQMNKHWRQEVRLLKVEARNEAKKIKYKTKSSPFLRFVGRMWWLLLIIGFAAGLYLKSFIPGLSNIFKR